MPLATMDKESIKEKVIPSGPKEVAEPEKELRFTRAAQAPLFYLLAIISFCVAMAFFILSTQNWSTSPLLPGWWWVCFPTLILFVIFLRLGMRCSRHAYILLTPLGVEVFPFFKPEKNLQVIYWSEIADAEVQLEKCQLTLHYNQEKTGGVVVTLKPILPAQRELLATAVNGVMAKLAKS